VCRPVGRGVAARNHTKGWHVEAAFGMAELPIQRMSCGSVAL
jgi:hypothetical protein